MKIKAEAVCVRCGQFRKITARSMCNPCYMEEWKRGEVRAALGPIKRRKPHTDREVPLPRHVTLANPDMYRFWSKVELSNGCWEWQGTHSTYGYGLFSYLHRNFLAHRVAYELIKGLIPDDREIDHLCRNRLCVNPAHLEAVPHRENVLRGNAPQALNRSRQERAQKSIRRESEVA